MSKVYTRRGDAGETDLFGGARVSKDVPRVEAYGAVDELNSAVGVCAAATPHDDLRAALQRVQGELFELGSLLAAPDPASRRKAGLPEPADEDIARLEAEIDAFDRALTPLRRFVLPGGTPAAAACHAARTTCRRAERRAVALHKGDPLPTASLRYLNRLSDWLFTLARLENQRAGVGDVEWEGRKG